MTVLGKVSISRRRHAVWSLLACILLAGAFAAASAHADTELENFEKFDLESVSAMLANNQAGAHSDFVTSFTVNGDPTQKDPFGQPLPWAPFRDLSVEIPPGLTGNAKAFPTCKVAVFTGALEIQNDPSTEECPTDSQVGMVSPGIQGAIPPGFINEPLYNLQPPGGDVVARLGFYSVFFPTFIDIRLDPKHENSLVATATSTANVDTSPLTGAITTIWGVPTDSSHDSQRFNPFEAIACEGVCPGTSIPASGLGKTAFMSNPTSCGEKEVGFNANVYPLPARFVHAEADLGAVENCEAVPFKPVMSISPTERRAGSPSGVDVDLKVPQESITDPSAIRTADLKDARVTLPKGVSLGAAAADGLEGCSEAQIGLESTSPVVFDANEANCPDSSRVGTVKIVTPVLENPLEGSLYIARQGENPSHSLLAGYIVAKGNGATIKQAARFELNPDTGQITAIVENAPQQPFSELEMHLKGGARGVLQMPRACGTYASEYELTPWSGNAAVKGLSFFAVDEGCKVGGFHPELNAGATNPVGGDYSPFVFNVSRDDGEQNIGSLDVTLPSGETAKLAGVDLCPEGNAVSGNCPASSQIGSVATAVGSGTLPLWVPQAGRAPTAVYLAGPYKGAPYSIVAKVPAQAGPFDLGVVAVRSGIYVDPETTQVTVRSDALPQILQGIPILYRDIHVGVDRSRFSLNPTSCATKAVNATIASSEGARATPSDRFQVGGCRELTFKPKLSLRLKGGTRRGAHPSLRAVLRMQAGGANIARAQVALPHSEFLENSHIKTVCTRVQFAAGSCPAASIYGRARAITPLLDKPLSGPVYLRSSSHKLPDLVADLHGQIHVVLDGRIDSVNGGIRNTFEAVPDAPVSKFVLEMQGGRKGLLVNSTNLCRSVNRVTVRFDGQNGKTADSNPPLVNGCGGGGSARGR